MVLFFSNWFFEFDCPRVILHLNSLKRFHFVNKILYCMLMCACFYCFEWFFLFAAKFLLFKLLNNCSLWALWSKFRISICKDYSFSLTALQSDDEKLNEYAWNLLLWQKYTHKTEGTSCQSSVCSQQFIINEYARNLLLWQKYIKQKGHHVRALFAANNSNQSQKDSNTAIQL